MNRKEVMEAVSSFSWAVNSVDFASKRQPPIQGSSWASDIESVKTAVIRADTFLAHLKCMDDRWHEYVEGGTLPPPLCESY
jgi:hypothetical protein